MKILVTGVAGFIGMHTAARLLAQGHEVVGVDDLNPYYSVELKRARLEQLQAKSGFVFCQADVSEPSVLNELFQRNAPRRVVHLAAQAGVRYSVTHPETYLRSNLVGFGNVLECCRHHAVEHLVYASSSSVYGANTELPFQEDHNVDHPVSLYAATKKANELMAHCYSHLYRLPTTGLRFFTVYGPWGRPDMSPMLFASAILAGKPIDVFNHGKMARDFTYIDDIVEGIVRVLDKPATPDPSFDARDPRASVSNAPYRVFNIGNSDPVPLVEYIGELEKALGVEAVKNLLPMQPGDVVATAADTQALNAWVGFNPSTPLAEGARRFVAWYRQYYA